MNDQPRPHLLAARGARAIESVTLKGKRKRLVSFKPKGKDGPVLVRFDAAGSRLAYSVIEQAESGPDQDAARYVEIHSGLFGGPYPKVDGCAQPTVSGPEGAGDQHEPRLEAVDVAPA